MKKFIQQYLFNPYKRLREADRMISELKKKPSKSDSMIELENTCDELDLENHKLRMRIRELAAQVREVKSKKGK